MSLKQIIQQTFGLDHVRPVCRALIGGDAGQNQAALHFADGRDDIGNLCLRTLTNTTPTANCGIVLAWQLVSRRDAK